MRRGFCSVAAEPRCAAWAACAGVASSPFEGFGTARGKMALCFNSLTCVSKLHLEDFALRSVSRQHCRNRAQQNLEIERQAPALHVFKIQLHARFKRRIGARDDLPESGYAWFHIQAPVIVGTVSRVVVYGVGPRTNQAHIPFQDIPELGQFVEAVLAKQAAEPRNARIIGDFEERVSALVASAQ